MLPNGKIQPSIIANNNLSPKPRWINNSTIREELEGSSLKQDKVTFALRNVVHYIVYELDKWSQNLIADFTLKDCLFGAVELTKNSDPDKYSYS